MSEKNHAAVELGRRGGRTKSEAQAVARRANLETARKAKTRLKASQNNTERSESGQASEVVCILPFPWLT